MEVDTHKNCLNCSRAIAENFCAYCGQKTTTHRYSFKHFIAHDLVHGIWHVDNGLLFTLKALFTRPGHSVREYVNGKRVSYFNFFTLLLIMLGVGLFFSSYSTVKMADLVADSGREAAGAIEKFFEKYPKAMLLMTIPVYSVFSWAWFKRTKLNLTEHFVLNSYKTAAEMVFTTTFTIITIFYQNLKVLALLNGIITLLSLAYSVVFYYQFFSVYGYRKKSLIVRSIAVPITYMFFYASLGIVWKVVELATKPLEKPRKELPGKPGLPSSYAAPLPECLLGQV